MLCIFFGKLTVWLERIEERRLSEHLASSTDLIELEHRMRSAERIDYFVWTGHPHPVACLHASVRVAATNDSYRL
jgi:hypothetical protein